MNKTQHFKNNFFFCYPAKLFRRMLFSLMVIIAVSIFSLKVCAQVSAKDSLLQEVTLKNAVDYAVAHQPEIQQSLIDQQITEATIRSKLADWYPQINFNYSLQHNFLVQTSIIGGNPVKLGVNNTSGALFSVSQNIFNRDVMLASRTQADVRLQGRQNTSSSKIDLAANVSKAFYDVLSTLQQIRVSETNIQRIELSLKDAYNQYKFGITDKIDYKRATITLNNSKATKRSDEELLKAKVEYLKYLMGYPVSGTLNIVYDSLQMEKEIALDTLQQADYNARIEYKILATQHRLLEYNVKYNRWAYLPVVSANGAYNFNYLNNDFPKLYSNNYPNSFAAVTMGFPIFQGGKRKALIREAELQLSRNDLDILSFKNSVNSGYTQALASYKSNYYYYISQKENLAVAQEVYDVIQLQYKSGIKAYLEVITAESDLRTSEINYYTALYQLLSSKVDVQKALGQINY